MRLLSEGQLVRGTYEVERFLGEGAFAEVYRVKHRFLGRQAMKVFKRIGMENSEIHQILGEAILLSRVGHPNIVRVFDANVIETQRGMCGYFTMEYVSGGSLDKFWKSHGGTLVPIQSTLDIIKPILIKNNYMSGESTSIQSKNEITSPILVTNFASINESYKQNCN